MAFAIIRIIVSAVVFYVLGVGSLWLENLGSGGGVFFIAGLVGVAFVNILISLGEVKDEVVELRKEITEFKKKQEESKSEDDKT